MKKTIVFDHQGDFAAMYAAELWCAKNGISSGSCQQGAPRGLLYGNIQIAKWRNLNAKERAALDGQMKGDMRNGPVTIEMKSAP